MGNVPSLSASQLTVRLVARGLEGPVEGTPHGRIPWNCGSVLWESPTEGPFGWCNGEALLQGPMGEPLLEGPMVDLPSSVPLQGPPTPAMFGAVSGVSKLTN